MLRAARAIVRYRGLLQILTARELKARYRGSLLGYVWSLVTPLLLLLVYTFVFSVIFTPRDESVDPYALFLVTGLFPWIWFQTSLLEGSAALHANAGLIRKATFPAELLPMVPVLANLVHFALALPVIAAAFWGFERWGGYGGASATVALLPAVVFVQLPLVAGLTLGFAALNAHFKDIKDILSNLLMILFFGTPILYSLAMVAGQPLVQRLIALNPLTPFTLGYQQVLFYGNVPSWQHWVQMVVISLVGWVVGATLFERLSETLGEVL